MIRANKAASQLFGHEISEMVGQTVNMLMPEALAALHDGFMTHHLETGEKRIM